MGSTLRYGLLKLSACLLDFIRSGKGCRIIDEDGNEFIDYVGSWGPLILGHAHPEILEALQRTMKDGTSFGAPTKREVELAELIR